MKWLSTQYSQLLAAVSVYTRIPAWKLRTLGQEDYRYAVHWLPIVGIFTGGTMALVALTLSPYLPQVMVVILVLTIRLIITGAFHEDGLGDFFDGFGGGHTQERVLEIMKDSHVGSYAVIGYILYYAFLISTLSYMPIDYLPIALLLSDTYGKKLGIAQILWLPYARDKATSKLGLVYYAHKGRFPNILSQLILMIVAIKALGSDLALMFLLLPLLPCFVAILYIRKRIGGYTGDTCGALVLLMELVSLLGLYFCSIIFFN